MKASTTGFYEWLIRVTTLIRAQQDPQEDELFEIFVRHFGEVLPFDELAKFDAASNTIKWYVGPGFEKTERTTGKNLRGKSLPKNR